METNYTLKRLKLFWPVFALLMLSSFFINAQNIVPLTSIDVSQNTIASGAEFCDELSATQTVVGTRLDHETPMGPMEINTSAPISSATVTVIWEWSLTGAVGTYQEITTVAPPAGITATPINSPTSPYPVSNGVTINAVTTGNYDLLVTAANQDVYFRRVVLVVTDDPGATATVPSLPVFFNMIDSGDICDENTIAFEEGALYEFCLEDTPGCVLIEGSDLDAGVCDAEYQWYSKTEGALAWTAIAGATAQDYTACVTQTTHFARDAGFDLVIDTFQCLSASVTVYVYPHPEVVPIIGDRNICIDREAAGADAPYRVDYEDELGYTFNWQVNAAYGTIQSGSQFSSNTSVNWFKETPCEGVSPAWIQVTVTSPEGCQTIIRDVVNIKKEQTATITTEDEQVLCGLYEAVGTTTVTYNYAYAIKLEADFTTVCEDGQWTAPACFALVVPTGDEADLDPFDGDTWELAPAGAATVWAVMFETEECCLDSRGYEFEWEEFGCGDDALTVATITADFYKPIPVVEAAAYCNVNKDAHDEPCTSICGDYIRLEGTPLPVYCFGEAHDDIVGTWTVKSAPVGADVDFSDANSPWTYVDVNGVYGEYVFTWTIENGVCGDKFADVPFTFYEPVEADAGDDQEICNSFNPGKTWVTTNLNAEIPTAGQGTWTLIAKPQGANDPTFPEGPAGLNNAKTQILVTSFGRYTFRWTVVNGLCDDYDDVNIDFYPGIKDVAIAPTTFSVCSLSFGTTISAARDLGNLSGPNNITHSIRGTILVEKLGTSGWAPATSGWNLSTVPTNWSVSGATINVVGLNNNNLSQALVFNMIEYGKYRLTWTAHIANQSGNKIITACEGTASGVYDLYWKPAAILVQEYENPQVCDLTKWKNTGTAAAPVWVVDGGTPVHLKGSDPFQITTPVVVTKHGLGTAASPFYYEWTQDHNSQSLWNRSRISWTVEKVVAPGEWGPATVTTVPGANADVYVIIPVDDVKTGQEITAYALVQGQYRFVYTITNLAGDCSDVAYQDITFLQKPYAGVDGEQEVCGFIDERDSDCEGWNSVTRFVADMNSTSSNVTLPTISGYWSIDLDDIIVGTSVVGEPQTKVDPVNNPMGLIGYLPAFSGGTWTPVKDMGVGVTPRYVLHDWIKVDGVLAYTVNASTGALVWAHGAGKLGSNTTAEIEVSRHGIFPFEWVATNPLSLGSVKGGCDDDVTDHTVYYKNTPLARDITPIRVVSHGGNLLYGGIQTPWDECYACDNDVTTFYMLERPIVEQAHGVVADDFHSLSGGFLSTIPGTQSVRWYTIDGGQSGAVINKPIKGGTIVKTYALQESLTTVPSGANAGSYHALIHNAPLLNFNKHHIVEIKWDNEPLGEIIYEEENTVTECVVTNKYVVNKVSPQVITGVTPVPAFTSEFDGDKHIYTLVDGAQNGENPIPGATYEWEVDGGEGSIILGGWYTNALGEDVWVNNNDNSPTHATVPGLGSAYVSDTEMALEGLYKIHAYWAAGINTTAIPEAHGLVKAKIPYYCHTPIADFVVYIIENTFAGQLKYWNEDETYIPTPYKFHPSNNFDYFYVHLYDVTDWVKANTPTSGANIGVKPKTVPASVVEALTPRIEKIMVDPANQSMQSYFEFKGLDVSKDYLLRVVDGGFYHLEEAGAVRPNDNFLSFTYTWNRWDGIGVNAADALAIMQMSAGSDLNGAGYWWVGSNAVTESPIYGFFSNAIANVNGDNAITLIDAFHVLNRFVGTFGQFQNNIPNFQLAGRKVNMLPENTFTTVGDFSASNANDLRFVFGRKGNVNYAGTQNPELFYYQSDVFMMTTSFNKMNLYLNASGDINSRFSVPGPGGVTTVAKSLDSGLSYTGIINAEVGDEVIIPVRLDNAATLGAISLGLNYNNQLIEVLDVNMAANNINHEDGFIRVADAIVGGRSFGQSESVLNIRARVIGEMDGAELFTLQPATQFHNAAGEIVDVTLNTDFVTTNAVTSAGSLEAGVLTIGNYPNPFRSSTTIEYTLPESGNVHLVVYNNVGQVVTTLVNETQQAGLQSVVLNSTDLGNNDGMFIYRISVEGQSRTYVGTGNFMLVK